MRELLEELAPFTHSPRASRELPARGLGVQVRSPAWSAVRCIGSAAEGLPQNGTTYGALQDRELWCLVVAAPVAADGRTAPPSSFSSCGLKRRPTYAWSGA